MVKATSMDDVKHPDKVAPSATARPIIITNHSGVANDPMVTSVESKEEPAASVLSHTARSLAPLSSTPPAPAEDKASEDTEKPSEDTAEEPTLPADKSSEDGAETEAEKPVRSSVEPSKPEEKPEPSAPTSAETASSTTPRDSDAAINAEVNAAAEAKSKRDAELESIIASGQFAVPINAVQRRRSKLNIMLLSLLAVLLLAALADAVVDVGILKLPSSVPRTHFFSKH